MGAVETKIAMIIGWAIIKAIFNPKPRPELRRKLIEAKTRGDVHRVVREEIIDIASNAIVESDVDPLVVEVVRVVSDGDLEKAVEKPEVQATLFGLIGELLARIGGLISGKKEIE